MSYFLSIGFKKKKSFLYKLIFLIFDPSHINQHHQVLQCFSLT